MAAEAGADALGFNFYPKSPRFVEPKSAKSLIAALPPMVDAVGVFVEMPMRQICALSFQLGLGSIQTFATADDASPFRLITAFRVQDSASLKNIDEYLRIARDAGRAPAAILVDAHVEGQLGGTGKTAPWKLLADYRPSVPLILAGGLTPDNVAEAIRVVRPFAVDVASGVEESPGRKDPDKVRRFVDNARNIS
jgi:phosphoribosylanthranilate isomerase